MDSSEKAKWAPVLLRLVMGIILSVAGYAKFLGIAGTIEYFTKHGFPVPVITAWFIALLEFGGGIALIIGLFARYLGVLFVIQFIVAVLWVKFPTQGYAGARLDLMLIAGAAALYFLGAGRLSVDSLWLEKQKREYS